MLNVFFRFLLLGAALMVGVLVFGLGYRYLFVVPELSVAPRTIAMVVLGSFTTGLGMAFLRRDHGMKPLMQLLIRLLVTVAGITCVAATLILAAVILKELLAPVPVPIDYADIAAMILIAGLITGLAVFLMDVRGRRSS